MSRPDLYDLAIDNGGLNLIPTEMCRDMHVGHKTAWTVLVHRLLYADSTGVMSWGTQTIADKLGLDRIRVREADELLLAAGLMAVVGKRVRGRTTSYRMLPQLLDRIADAHEEDKGEPETPDDDELAAELAREVGTESWHGELARKVGTESVAKKGSGVKRRGTRARATPQQPPPESPDKNPEHTTCALHGDTNPDTPCNGCRRARENRERDISQLQRTRRQAERDDAYARQLARARRDDRDPVTLNDLIPPDLADRPHRERLDWLRRHPVSA